MAKKKTQIPKYGTITLKGIQYYRTRITDADGKELSLYAATCEELYEKQLEARKQVEEIIFHRQHPTVAEYGEKCNRWGDNPEQFADFPLGHGGCAYIGRQGDIAVFIYRDDVPFFFHRYVVLRWLNGSADILLHLLQLVRQGFHVLAYLLGGDFGVYLRGLDIRVPQ